MVTGFLLCTRYVLGMGIHSKIRKLSWGYKYIEKQWQYSLSDSVFYKAVVKTLRILSCLQECIYCVWDDMSGNLWVTKGKRKSHHKLTKVKGKLFSTTAWTTYSERDMGLLQMTYFLVVYGNFYNKLALKNNKYLCVWRKLPLIALLCILFFILL